MSLRSLGRKLHPSGRAKLKPPPKVAAPELLTPEHRQWRKIVCSRAGSRCEWVEGGRRCERRAPEHRMIADHIRERADGGAPFDPANGQCLCVPHNTLKGVMARAARAARGRGV